MSDSETKKTLIQSRKGLQEAKTLAILNSANESVINAFNTSLDYIKTELTKIGK